MEIAVSQPDANILNRFFHRLTFDDVRRRSEDNEEAYLIIEVLGRIQKEIERT